MILLGAVCFQLSGVAHGQGGSGFFPEAYHPYVEECLRGGKNENSVDDEDLEAVLDQLVRLGEFGGAIELLKSRGELLSYRYRYLHGILLEECGQGALGSAIFLALARDMAEESGREMWNVEMLRDSQNRIPQAFNHVVRRPVMHFRNGLEDVFGKSEGDELAAKVHVHLGISFEAKSKRDSFPSNNPKLDKGDRGLFSEGDRGDEYDLPMLRGNALISSEPKSEEWMSETFEFFRKTAPEFSLISLSQMKTQKMNAPIPDQEVLRLVESIDEVNENAVRAFIELIPDFPEIEERALELFVQAKGEGQIFSSRTFLALADVLSAEGIIKLVEDELDNFAAIRRHQFMRLEPNFDHLWPGSAEPLMNAGLSLSLLTWLSLGGFPEDLDFSGIDHTAFQLVLAIRMKKEEGVESALRELISAGDSSAFILASSYLGAKGELEQAMGILTDAEGLVAGEVEKQNLLHAQINLCVRFRSSKVSGLAELAKRSTTAIQFSPLNDFDRNRLVDSMWLLGLERDIKINQNRFRGYRGLSHPGDPDEWSRGPADRSVRLATLEMLQYEKSCLLFGFEGLGRRGSYRTRILLRNSDQEKSRYAMASLLSGRAGDSIGVFSAMKKNYPNKPVFQKRWVESELIANRVTVETVSALKEDSDLCGEVFSQIERMKGEGRLLIKGILRRLTFDSAPDFRSRVISLAVSSFSNSGSGSIRPYRAPVDPFAAPDPFGGGRNPSISKELLELLYTAPELGAREWLVLALSSEGLVFEGQQSMGGILQTIAEDIVKKKGSRDYQPAKSLDSRLLALSVLEACSREKGFDFSDLDDFIQTLHDGKVDEWWEKLSKLNALRKGEPGSLTRAMECFTENDLLFDPILPFLQGLSGESSEEGEE